MWRKAITTIQVVNQSKINNYMIFLKTKIRKINSKILTNMQSFPKHMKGRSPNKHIV
jgi:hypothetical protein